MSHYVAVSIDLENKRATVYGKGGATLDFFCGSSRNNTEEIKYALTEFIKENGYAGWGNANNKQKELECELTFVSEIKIYSDQPINACTKYRVDTYINNLIYQCQQKAMFDERLAKINDAKAFFKALEKDDEMDFEIEVPVNCSSIPKDSIRTPKIIIGIKDNRTYLHDQSITRNLWLGSKTRVAVSDFSHWNESDYTYKSEGIILGGMDNFADAWEDVIKPAVLAEVERLTSREEIEFE